MPISKMQAVGNEGVYSKTLERNRKETSSFISRNSSGNYSINFELIKGDPARRSGYKTLKNFWDSLDERSRNSFGDFLVKYFIGMGTGKSAFSTLDKIIRDYTKNHKGAFDINLFKKVAFGNGRKAINTNINFTVKTAYNIAEKYLKANINKGQNKGRSSGDKINPGILWTSDFRLSKQDPEKFKDTKVNYTKNVSKTGEDSFVIFFKGRPQMRLIAKTGIFDGRTVALYSKGIKVVFSTANDLHRIKKLKIAHEPITYILKRIKEYDNESSSGLVGLVTSKFLFFKIKKRIHFSKWIEIENKLYSDLESGKLHDKIYDIYLKNKGNINSEDVADAVIYSYFSSTTYSDNLQSLSQ